MTEFQQALADFLRLQAIEQAITDETAVEAATEVTDAAFDRLISLPPESITQAAAKLAALASHYDVAGCGCGRIVWATLVGDICRFAAVVTFRVPA